MNKLYHNKTICLDFVSEENYNLCISSTETYRKFLISSLSNYPELFPDNMSDKWEFYGFTRRSKKLE